MYPGISHGTGSTYESIAEPDCIPWQYFINLFSSLNIIFCTISALGSLYFGSTWYPRLSKTLLVRIAVFNAFATTFGAKYNPCKNCLFIPSVGPTSFPSPGSVSLSAHSFIRSFFPTMYAPLGAIPPPRFFISDPTTMSAPTSVGYFFVTNSQ